MRRFLRAWLLAAVGTLVIHAVIVGYLAFHGDEAKDRSADGSETASKASTAGSAAGEESVEGFMEDPMGAISRRLDALAEAPPEELEGKLARQVERFSKFVKTESVDEIRNVIARAGGVDPAEWKYVPRDDATGSFDGADCVIHDIRPAHGEDATGYEIVMVDHKGVTAVSHTDRLSPEMQRVRRVYDMVRDRPALRSPVTTAWQIADRLDGDEP